MQSPYPELNQNGGTEPAHGSGGDATIASARTPTLLGLFDLFLRHAWLILGVAILTASVVGASILLRDRLYTSTASFLPQASSNSQGVLSGVASQLGIVVDGDQSGQSSDFYVSLLQLPATLERVVDAEYSEGVNGRKSTLIEIFAAGAPKEQRKRVAVNTLRNSTRISLDSKIGLVQVSVSLPDRTLSKQVVDSYLRVINEANLAMRQQRATDEAHFIDDRLATVRAELYAAEDRLQSFLRSNRDISNVDELVFQRDRLQRDVQLRQQIYLSLAQAYEQSRLDQVRDTPVITVVQPSTSPEFPDSRHLPIKVFFAALLGALFGMLLARLSEMAYFDDEDMEPSESRRLLRRVFSAFSLSRNLGTSRSGRANAS